MQLEISNLEDNISEIERRVDIMEKLKSEKDLKKLEIFLDNI